MLHKFILLEFWRSKAWDLIHGLRSRCLKNYFSLEGESVTRPFPASSSHQHSWPVFLSMVESCTQSLFFSSYPLLFMFSSIEVMDYTNRFLNVKPACMHGINAICSWHIILLYNVGFKLLILCQGLFVMFVNHIKNYTDLFRLFTLLVWVLVICCFQGISPFHVSYENLWT